MARTVTLIVRIAALLCLVAITILSVLGDPPDSATGSDKADHLLAYTGLSLLVTLSRRDGKPSLAWLGAAALMCAAYGGVLELVQSRIGRFSEWRDEAANAAGSLIGAGVGTLVLVVVGRLRASRAPRSD